MGRDSLTRKAHILEQLLTKGHSVVTTVRSEEKAAPIRAAYPDKTSDELSIVIVPDIAKPDAFDEVVKVPGIEVVFHTASPFYFNFSTWYSLPAGFQLLTRTTRGCEDRAY